MEVIPVILQHIRSLREASRLSQKEIAARINLDIKNYAKLERGAKKRLDLDRLLCISGALGMDVAVMLQPLKSEPVPVQDAVTPSVNANDPNGFSYEQIINQLRSIVRKQGFIIAELDKLLIDRMRTR